MLTFTATPLAAAAWAADVPGADVIPFTWVAETVRRESRYRATVAAAARDGALTDADVADRMDESAARVLDAVADVSDGWATDVVPVVVLETCEHAAAGTLHAAGVAYVRPLNTVAGGYVAGRDGCAAVAFDRLADAVAYAAGQARRPLLPGEQLPPPAPSHGAAAPSLPSIADAFMAENERLRAAGDAAAASALDRLARMRQLIDAELLRGY